MKPFCEPIVKNIFPLVRSIITEIMLKEYNMSQLEIAKKLDISQAAVSYYLNGLRAKQVNIIKQNKELMKKIEDFVKEIVYSDLDENRIQEFFCDVCRKIRDGKIKI